MSLSEIKNKLYSKNLDGDLSKHGGSEFDIRMGGVKMAPEKIKQEDEWKPEKTFFGIEQKKAVKMGVISVVVMAVVVFVVFGIVAYKNASFSESRVVLSIDGTKESPSGKLLTYEISYSNNNRASLTGAVLRVNYPEGFKPGENSNFKTEGQTSGVFALGDIVGKANGKVILTGNAYSPRGTLMYFKTELAYTPSNLNSQFVSKAQLGVNINSSPVDIEIMAPQELSSGDSLDYEIKYMNTGAEDFNNIKIKIDYPDNFVFSRGNPATSEGNNIWYIGHLEAGQAGKIIASGKLAGNRDEIKNVSAFIGTSERGQFVGYNEGKTATKIIASPIVISQTVNGVNELIAKVGDTLRYVVSYKNESAFGLRDVIITSRIDSPILDYGSLNLQQQGAFDQNNKLITWKGADSPSLKFLGPGQSGEVVFSIKVKDVIPVDTGNGKNFVVSSLVKIDSLDIPEPIQSNKVISGNTLDIKLSSKIFVDVKGFYNDTVIPNSGPIPPKVGQSTTYTIHWKAYNVSNNIANAQIAAELPTGVTMTGKMEPDDGKLTYNARNNSMLWDIGNMDIGTGILNAPKEVSFQVQITPAQNQIESIVDLVGPTIFSAKDLFTNSDVSFTADKKTTGLFEDPGIKTGYKVMQ